MQIPCSMSECSYYLLKNFLVSSYFSKHTHARLTNHFFFVVRKVSLKVIYLIYFIVKTTKAVSASPFYQNYLDKMYAY